MELDATMPSTSANSADAEQLRETFRLLEEGERKIKFNEQHRDVILVLGSTGDGKSTFVQWLAGDNDKLTSVDAGAGHYIIEDEENTRIGSSITSKTCFPELVVWNNAAFYDCPGFDDTRSTSYDIACTYFIKKVADHTLKVKIVLVINYSAVQKGEDRDSFMRLLRHTLDLVKNVKKFENSIAIAITKVGRLKNQGMNYILVPDEQVIVAIAVFLKTVEKTLLENLKLTGTTHKEKGFCEKAIQLIDILQTQVNDKYTRIGLFRRPDEPGVLLSRELLQQGKDSMRKMVYEHLEFTEIENTDFGYTISDRSKNDVNMIANKINDNVWVKVEEICDKLKANYENLIEEINRKIASFEDSTTINFRTAEAHAFLNQLKTWDQIVSELCSCSDNINDLTEKIEKAVALLGADTFSENTNNISTQVGYYNFLQTVSQGQLNSKPWASLFRGMAANMSTAKQVMQTNITRTKEVSEIANADKITCLANNLAKEIKEYYTQKMESFTIIKLLSELNRGYDMVQEIQSLKDAQSLSNKINDLFIRSDGFTASSQTISDISNLFYYENYLSFLKIFNCDDVIDSWSTNWEEPFNNTKQFLSDLGKWFTFLQDLYRQFSEYVIQSQLSKYNVQNIADWGEEGKPQGIHITQDNFQSFLEKIGEYNIKEFDFVKNMRVTSLQLQVLNNKLKLLLRQTVEKDYSESGKLIVRGNFVKFSDFIDIDGKIEGENLNSVEIFSLNTVFIDRDLIGPSKAKVSIVSPNWQIIGDRTINLDGVPGIAHNPPKAANAVSMLLRMLSQFDGKPGLPGGAAGSFLGIANKLINVDDLTVTTNGGQGGPGQEGGDGIDGEPGRLAEATADFECTRLRMVFGVFQDEYEYKFHGKPGRAGIDGGNGGTGGYGGSPGTIKIIQLNNSSQQLPTTVSEGGTSGIHGAGGIGGRGGRRGDDLKVLTRIKKFWIGFDNHESYRTFLLTTDRAASGQNGALGETPWGMQEPEPAIKLQSIARVVNGYKMYVRQNLGDIFNKYELSQFLDQLEAHVDIQSSYETLDFVKELKDLETQFHIFYKTLDFLPFYETLLNRISEYARHLQSSENTNSHREVLGYLYTATLSRIVTLKSVSEPNLIIDLENYLIIVRENISLLKTLQEKSQKVTIINQYKEAYKENIEAKIKEARIFIKDRVNPELGVINGKVQQKIDLLLDETKTLIDQARSGAAQLVRKKEELESAIMTSWLLSVFKIFGQVVGCFSGVGAVASLVIGSTSELLESLTSHESLETIQLSDDVLSAVASAIQKLGTLEQEIGKKPSSNTRKLLTGLQKAMQLGAIGTDIINKIKNDTEKMQMVNDAIEQQKDKINQLEEYEAKIYNIVIPILKNTGRDLATISSQLTNKSQVTLDVTKWQVQSLLKDIKSQMRQITKGFAIQDDLARCIEKLAETMTTQIKIYDRIQNYQDQKRLATYIADISSSANGISTSNDSLSLAIKDLEIIIRSNMVLEQYKAAVNALTQQVFPFAHHYLQETNLPHHLQSEGDFTNLVDKAIEQVDNMITKVKHYKTSITVNDTYFRIGWFNRRLVSSQPFFTWENSKHQDVLVKLLSGEKIALWANIFESPQEKDAIKLKSISWNLYSENPETTEKIHEKLKGFKVSATHLGNSYYRYNSNIYVITNSSLNIEISFEKEEGEPVEKNGVYEKIKSGDLMVSPYAMWEIQLIKTSKIQFSDLKKFNDVNLELVGYGSYVTRGTNLFQIDMDNYYRAEN